MPRKLREFCGYKNLVTCKKATKFLRAIMDTNGVIELLAQEKTWIISWKLD